MDSIYLWAISLCPCLKPTKTKMDLNYKEKTSLELTRCNCLKVEQQSKTSQKCSRQRYTGVRPRKLSLGFINY